MEFLKPPAPLHSSPASECEIYGTGPSPAVVEVLLVLIAVEDGEGEHPASDDLSFLEQLSQVYGGVIYSKIIIIKG